jgi:integrase
MPTIDFEARVETTINSIQASDEFHPDNKELIQNFKRDLKLEGLSDGWLQKLTAHLKVIGEHLGDTRFEDMNEDDVKDLVEWAQNRTKENGDDIADATVNAYKQVIKRFWRWMHDLPRGEHPEPVAWINTTANNSGNGKLPTDLLTREDIEALKDACRNDRDRAFIAMLYETGARIGELIDLSVGDIEDHKHGRKVVIDGKTGPRRLPLLEATPAINDWLNDHPDPTPDAPLWCKLRSPEKVSYHYIRQKLLVRAGERAAKYNPEEFASDPDAVADPEVSVEFYKPLNPHHFRHSRASHLANEFTEAQLCEWFGWVQGSDVPAKYVHLSGRDIDNAYGQLHGIEPEDAEDSGPTIAECWRCEEINEADDRFCSRCGAALDEDAAETFEDQVEGDIKQSYREVDPEDPKAEKLDTLDNLLDDPEVRTALLERFGE